jgi:hypothetical protein
VSPVSPNEVRAIDEALDALEVVVRNLPNGTTKLVLVALGRTVHQIWQVLKREHGWQ